MDAVVLAGGRGTRLSQHVPNVPKPMACVAGRPFIDFLLHALVDEGVTRIILSVGHLADQIVAHVGSRFRGVPVVYAREDEPLGTGGAIRLSLKLASTPRVIVVNGDTFLDAPLTRFFRFCSDAQAKVGVVVRLVPEASRYGACVLEGTTVVQFGEKTGVGPGLINAGIYCLERQLLEGMELPNAFSFEQDVLAAKLQLLKPVGFAVDGYFIDIGIPGDYDRAQSELPKAFSSRFSGRL
ncbi:nucleotidyltransferase family protein [Aquincola sp. MAHUQ-54]|uniref:Nucleotidyltransferase family protein n=1 Tax=Aquincola agrisoli TaxID=3119538 RepID=A0AAW9QLP3_9BURK